MEQHGGVSARVGDGGGGTGAGAGVSRAVKAGDSVAPKAAASTCCTFVPYAERGFVAQTESC